jgi:hypothetical protein
MDMNEGNEVENNKIDGKVTDKARVKGFRGKKTVEKWIDEEVIIRKVERDMNGKLGVRERDKFVLWNNYSGKSFKDLEDLVPMRETSLSLFYEFGSIYWMVLKRFTGKFGKGGEFGADDLGILFLMKRFEDANAGSFFTRAMLAYWYRYSGARDTNVIMLTNAYVKKMRARGLVEQIPGLKVFDGQKIAIYRVSATGRALLKEFIEAFKQVHQDIRHFAKDPEGADYLGYVMGYYCLGVDHTRLKDAEGNDVTFDDMIELTKRDLKAMGYRGTGTRPDFWKDLPD